MTNLPGAASNVKAAVARILDPYKDNDRVRMWANIIFLSIVIITISLLLKFLARDDNVGSVGEFANLSRYVPFSIVIASSAILYSLLQLFLDGALSIKRRMGQISLGGEILFESGNHSTANDGEESKLPVSPRRQTPRYVAVANGMRNRLKREISSQGRKSQTNLGMGVLTALAAIGFLSWLAWSTSEFQRTTSLLQNPQNSIRMSPYIAMNFWALFAAKLALSFTASVFSFFFLSTYRKNLGEIKYFQNELTNIEIRLFSIYLATNRDMTEVTERLLVKMSDVERNFIIKKGETTVDSRSRELDNIDSKILTDALGSILAPLLHGAKKGNDDNA